VSRSFPIGRGRLVNMSATVIDDPMLLRFRQSLDDQSLDE